MPEKLSMASYDWAVRHLRLQGDSDLFPALFETSAFRHCWQATLRRELHSHDVEAHDWRGGQRFVVPKDPSSFRIATRLDPVDALIFAALMKKYGKRIEAARIPVSDERVFSYRFLPQSDGRFYGNTDAWRDFWQASIQRALACEVVVVTDISDYYNQIYHHTLENQLREAALPETVVGIVKRFLSATLQTESRGIPVGPHSTHLLAECAMNGTDRSLLAHGHNFCRYVDDFHFFCASREAAQIALFDFAEILDRQQRLVMAKSKTRIVSSGEFIQYAAQMLTDRPRNEDEARILNVIRDRSGADPYRLVGLKELSDDELAALDDTTLENLLDLYLGEESPDFPRIGWLLRRLAQVGVPGALPYVVRRLGDLLPVVGNVARYIMSAAPNYNGDIVALGEAILAALRKPVVAHSRYLGVVLVDLFARVPDLNHLDSLTAMYLGATEEVRREIVRAASAGDGAWLRELKYDFRHMGPWLRRAFLASLPSLPGDEPTHWIRSVRNELSGLEKLVLQAAFPGVNLRVGAIRLFG